MCMHKHVSRGLMLVAINQLTTQYDMLYCKQKNGCYQITKTLSIQIPMLKEQQKCNEFSAFS